MLMIVQATIIFVALLVVLPGLFLVIINVLTPVFSNNSRERRTESARTATSTAWARPTRNAQKRSTTK